MAPIMIFDDNGIPRTINRCVKVKMIARKHLIGEMSISDIAEHCGIELADVYAALANYHDNKMQMDTEYQEAEALLQEVGVSHEELKAKVLKRMSDKGIHSSDEQ